MAKDFKNALKKMEQPKEEIITEIKEEKKAQEVKPVITTKDITKKDLELLLLDYANDNRDSSYTLKGTKPLMDLLKSLACVQKISIKDLYIKALNDYIRNSNIEDINEALFYKEKYIK